MWGSHDDALYKSTFTLTLWCVRQQVVVVGWCVVAARQRQRRLRWTRRSKSYHAIPPASSSGESRYVRHYARHRWLPWRRWRTCWRLSFLVTHANSSRVSIAIMRICDSVCLSVRTIKPKRLKPKSPNLAQSQGSNVKVTGSQSVERRDETAVRHRLVAVVSSHNKTVPHGRLVAQRHNRAGLSYWRRSSGRRQLCTLSSAQPLVSSLFSALWFHLVNVVLI